MAKRFIQYAADFSEYTDAALQRHSSALNELQNFCEVHGNRWIEILSDAKARGDENEERIARNHIAIFHEWIRPPLLKHHEEALVEIRKRRKAKKDAAKAAEAGHAG